MSLLDYEVVMLTQRDVSIWLLKWGDGSKQLIMAAAPNKTVFWRPTIAQLAQTNDSQEQIAWVRKTLKPNHWHGIAQISLQEWGLHKGKYSISYPKQAKPQRYNFYEFCGHFGLKYSEYSYKDTGFKLEPVELV